MKSYMKRALRNMEAARPASGYLPQTEREWRKLQSAQLEFFVAQLRSEGGLSPTRARMIADLIFGGQSGRKILEMAFSEDAK